MTTATHPHAPSTNGVRPKTLRGLVLARELDATRNQRGLTTRKLAEQMRMSPAMCNRVMTGRRVPTALEIGGFCAVLDVPADRRPTLYSLARTAAETQWIIHRGHDTEILSVIEAEAQTITSVCPSPIPKPLRTRAYHSERGEGQATRPERLADSYLLHPAALHDTTANPQVMSDQLRHLTSLPQAIRLLPNGTPPQGAFRVIHIEHFHPIVCLDHTATTVILESPGATAPYTDAVTTLTNSALSTRETQEALIRLAISTV